MYLKWFTALSRRQPAAGSARATMRAVVAVVALLLGGLADAKKNLTPTAHVAVDMGSQFLKISAEQSVRGESSCSQSQRGAGSAAHPHMAAADLTPIACIPRPQEGNAPEKRPAHRNQRRGRPQDPLRHRLPRRWDPLRRPGSGNFYSIFIRLLLYCCCNVTPFFSTFTLFTPSLLYCTPYLLVLYPEALSDHKPRSPSQRCFLRSQSVVF